MELMKLKYIYDGTTLLNEVTELESKRVMLMVGAQVMEKCNCKAK